MANTFLATAAFGLEGVVAGELKRMGLPAKAENGGARFEGIVYTIEGVTKAQLYQRGADGYNILTYTGFDWESVRSMLEASTLA